MPNSESLCQHLNEIIDQRQGDVICTDCGLVLSEVYYKENNFVYNKSKHEKQNEVDEILERLHLPECFTSDILVDYDKTKTNKKNCLIFSIYHTLNKLGFPISLKEISSVTGVSDSKIYDVQNVNESVYLSPEQLLEKFCKILNLNYNAYTVIKESLPKTLKTGHNPLTIAATYIHIYCKKNKLKYSMKKIATVCNISCISIQRYLKHLKSLEV
jgi:transcription initiation factor TFIIIB Brf1 subunit/transcription initiation factor TFIIB